MRRHGIDDPHHLVIVHDELDLPVGRLKLKVGGGLAGNNGLKSIRPHLHTDDFARVRIGIGKPNHKTQGADHVLKRPGKGDRGELDIVVQEAADAVELILTRRHRRGHEPLQHEIRTHDVASSRLGEAPRERSDATTAEDDEGEGDDSEDDEDGPEHAARVPVRAIPNLSLVAARDHDGGMTETALIVGQGYVGLPLAMRAVAAGYDVVGYDVDEHRSKALAAGTSFVEDISDAEVADGARHRPLPGRRDRSTGVERFDVAVITVPTPLREGIPDLTFIDEAGAQLAPLLTRGRHGGAREHHLPRHHRGAARPRSSSRARACGPAPTSTSATAPSASTPATRPGRSPTRPKVVSGIDAASLAKVEGFYDRIVDTTVPVTHARRRPSSPSCSRTRSGT